MAQEKQDAVVHSDSDHGPVKNDIEKSITSTPQIYNGRGSATDRALVFKQDLRIVPLSAGIYLLCYLDRSNIGNAKVLNADTGDDLLQETGMTNFDYTIALM